MCLTPWLRLRFRLAPAGTKALSAAAGRASAEKGGGAILAEAAGAAGAVAGATTGAAAAGRGGGMGALAVAAPVSYSAGVHASTVSAASIPVAPTYPPRAPSSASSALPPTPPAPLPVDRKGVVGEGIPPVGTFASAGAGEQSPRALRCEAKKLVTVRSFSEGEKVRGCPSRSYIRSPPLDAPVVSVQVQYTAFDQGWGDTGSSMALLLRDERGRVLVEHDLGLLWPSGTREKLGPMEYEVFLGLEEEVVRQPTLSTSLCLPYTHAPAHVSASVPPI